MSHFRLVIFDIKELFTLEVGDDKDILTWIPHKNMKYCRSLALIKKNVKITHAKYTLSSDNIHANAKNTHTR